MSRCYWALRCQWVNHSCCNIEECEKIYHNLQLWFWLILIQYIVLLIWQQRVVLLQCLTRMCSLSYMCTSKNVNTLLLLLNTPISDNTLYLYNFVKQLIYLDRLFFNFLGINAFLYMTKHIHSLIILHRPSSTRSFCISWWIHYTTEESMHTGSRHPGRQYCPDCSWVPRCRSMTHFVLLNWWPNWCICICHRHWHSEFGNVCLLEMKAWKEICIPEYAWFVESTKREGKF